jgi:hypothetical protein
MKRLIGFLLLLNGFLVNAQDTPGYQTPPDVITQLVDAPATPAVLFAPDKSVMVMLDRSDLPSIEELSRPELRIAGLRINPDNFGPSRNNFFIGMKVKKLSDTVPASHPTVRSSALCKHSQIVSSFGLWI